jgi:putative oxidoreductase
MSAPSATLEGIPGRSVRLPALLGLLVPAGRVLYSVIFLVAVQTHFMPATIGYAAAQGVRFPEVVVPLAGILAAVGGLSVAFGYHTRLGAGLLVAFLVPVTLAMHNFWTVSDPVMAAIQQAMFMKNLSILGGALLIAYYGPGPFSLDALRAKGV